MSEPTIPISGVRGRPMLVWAGKRPLGHVRAMPAQKVEAFDPTGALASPPADPSTWADWPDRYPRGGVLFHGDNKEVLAHLLANGFRGKVKLIYIDPPFDSGADYVRHVSLRGSGGGERIEGDAYTLGEQVQYSDIWANDLYLQFIYERTILLRELLAVDGSLFVHCDWHRSHLLRCLLDEVFGSDNLQNEVIWQRTDPHNDAKPRFGWIHDTIFWYGKDRSATADAYNWQEVLTPLSEAALKEYSLVRTRDDRVVSHDENFPAEGRRFKLDDCTYKGTDQSRRFVWRGATPSSKRVWPYASAMEMDEAVTRGEFYLRNPDVGAARCRVSYLDEREGQVLQTIWNDCGRMKGGVEYPTEKPEALLGRIVRAASRPGDIVLDCFIGSGTTAAVAQRLGRRWIGCDINKGAIHATARRLDIVIRQQIADAEKARRRKAQTTLVADGGVADGPAPAQLGFTSWRVNDYDLAVQHNEAVQLACERVGVQRTLTDSFFDGSLGGKLAKVIPFNHPLSALDLEELRRTLEAREEEDRTIVLVCLGIEIAAQAWIEAWNRYRKGKDAANRIEVIELRSDPRYGGVIRHEPALARVGVERRGDRIHVVLEDFISPTIIERLRQQAGLLQPRIDDFRSMIDCVTIDPAFDGQAMNVVLSDVPERKTDLVTGRYELPAPEGETTVAVKVVDMLGEEVLTIARV